MATTWSWHRQPFGQSSTERMAFYSSRRYLFGHADMLLYKELTKTFGDKKLADIIAKAQTGDRTNEVDKKPSMDWKWAASRLVSEKTEHTKLLQKEGNCQNLSLPSLTEFVPRRDLVLMAKVVSDSGSDDAMLRWAKCVESVIMERALEWSSIAAKNKRTAYVRVAGMLVAAQVVRRFGEGRS